MTMGFGTRPTTSISDLLFRLGVQEVFLLVNKPNLIFVLSNIFPFTGMVFDPFKAFC